MNKFILAFVVTMAAFTADACSDLDFATAQAKCALEQNAREKQEGKTAPAAIVAGQPNEYCAIAEKGYACLLKEGCWPKKPLPSIRDPTEAQKARITCQNMLSSPNTYNCTAAHCDSGSMATPMVSLFAVIAATFYD